MRKITVPTFRYPGGKSQLSSIICKYIPLRGRKFVDVFAGRGNITFRAMAEGLDYREWVLNDIGRAPFLRALMNYGDQFKVTEKSKAEFDRLSKLAERNDPHALLMEPFLAFNGGTFDGGGSTTEGGRGTPERYEENVRLACEFLRKHKVRITNLDWLDCLEAEKLGPDDFVMVDAPYIGCEVGAYSAESICPTELIEYLKLAKFNWVLTEYRQPLYVEAFGEPIFEKKVQLRAPNFENTAGQGIRIECIWTNIGKSAINRDAVTVPFEPVPDDPKDTFYSDLAPEELLGEIRKCAAAITAARNQMNKEMRTRLLPALLELRKRTYRKHPGYYETLAAIGLPADTVRQWFYRSHTADEVIELVEEETTPSTFEGRGGTPPPDVETELLRHADKIAKAVLDNKITFAKRLATEYLRVREETRD